MDWHGLFTVHRDLPREAPGEAGFEALGARRLSDAVWEASFGSMETRIAALRAGADAALAGMRDLCAAEADHCRAVRDETGFLLTVACAP